MITRERFQELLLDHLYDLLDEADAQAVREYVQAHPEAQAEVTRVRGLLAAAARVEFPQVRFAAPQGEVVPPAASPRPVVAQQPRRASMQRYWAGWAVAACLLLGTAALALPTTRHLIGYYQHKEQVALARENVNRVERQRQDSIANRRKELELAQQRVEDATRNLTEIDQKFNQERVEAERLAADKQLFLIVTGPPAIQPGAPNHFQIQTVQRQGAHAAARLNVKVRDQAGNIVFEEKEARTQGLHNLILPPDLAFRPNTQLAFEVNAVAESGPRADVTEKLSWSTPRYVAHLATDKPMYQPGQRVFFRSLTLNRATLQPPEEDFQVTFSITAPSGAVIWSQTGETRLLAPQANDRQARILLGPDSKPVRGIGVADFLLPDALEGGEYTLAVREMSNRFPEEKRKFLVNKYTPDRLNKELEFTKKSYGPNEEVLAVCKVSLAEGGPLVGVRPVVTAQVDGRPIRAEALGQTDATGTVRVKAFLPKEMEKGKASLNVLFSDGGSEEPILRPIPIVLKKLFLEYFPEGGDVVAGVPNRVYYQVKTTQDKPGELRARVVDSKGETVATTETSHDDIEPGANQGLGAFTFTPSAGEKYSLQIDEPAGVEAIGKFPEIKPDGIALNVPSGVTAAGEPIQVVLHATGKPRDVLVGAYCRGRMLDHRRVRTEAGKPATVELTPDDSVGGVVRITAFEEKGTDANRLEFVPRAERLVYRRSSKKVQFNVQPDKSRYAPGDPVNLTVSATDEQGRPARAILTMSVVNQTVVTMADIKTDRTMPTHFALVGEVKKAEDLEHADFILNETNPKAALTLDLLLGVQGWRRFAEQDPEKFRRQNAVEAERVLVMTGQSGQQMQNTLFARQQEIASLYAPKVKDSEEQLRVAVEQQVEVNAKRGDFAVESTQRQRAEADANQAYAAAMTQLRPYENVNRELRQWLMPSLAVLALVVALVSVTIAVLRGVAKAVPYYATAAASLVAGVLLVVGIFGSGDSASPRDGAVAENARSAAQLKDETRVLAEAEIDKLGGLKDAPAAPDDRLAEALGKDGKAKGLEREKMAPRLALEAAPAPPGPAAAARAKPEVDAAKVLDAARPENQPQALMLQRPNADPAVDKKAVLGAMVPVKAIPAAKPGAAGMADKDKMEANLKFKKGDEEFRKRVALARQAGKDRDGLMQGGGMPGAAGMMGPGGPGIPGDMRMGGFGRPATPPMRGGGGGGGLRGAPGMEGMPGMPGQADAPFGAGFQFARMPAVEPFFVREYRHFVPEVAGPKIERNDFTETVLWQPVLVLPEEGKTTVTFNLADSVTRYRVLVSGHTVDGRLGSHSSQIESRKPFSVEAKLPVEVTAGDKLDIPVIVVNDTDGERHAKITISPQNFQLRTGSAEESVLLKPNQRSRRVFRLQPSIVEGVATLKIAGTSEPFAQDGLERTIPVVPDGFPVNGAVSDLLEKVAEHAIELPEGYVKGTVKLKAQIFPTTLADLQKGLEGLLREPGGCFEQTSTSNYPNTLILQYLRESDQANPQAAQRASDMLDRGYKRLTSFECQKASNDGREGYEWFGGMAPPHEALTAYGLLQFKDMAQVSAVDEEMIKRTRQYLLSRRKPDGSFERNSRALDTFGRAPQHITDAYIVWALSETGKEDLSKEINKLLQDQKESKDPYFLSLLANALLNRDRANEAIELLKKVRDKQAADGGLDATETSITHSGGRDLRIETTALAVLAWMKANKPAEFTTNIDKAVRWIGQQRGGYGGFGSTQSTILALKALIAHTKANKKPAEGGTVKLYVNGKLAGFTDFAANTQDAIAVDLKDAEAWLKPGKNDVKLTLNTVRSYPFTLGWSYQTVTPNSDPKCAVKLSTSLNKTQVREGDTVRLTAVLENLGGKDKGQPMTVAVIGLPAGLKVPEDMKQLKEMAALRKTGPSGELEAGEIGYFEIRGRELVLYWRDLKPEAKIEVNLDLIANIPGEFRGPASRAYLYYTADLKHWVKPLELTIEAPSGE